MPKKIRPRVKNQDLHNSLEILRIEMPDTRVIKQLVYSDIDVRGKMTDEALNAYYDTRLPLSNPIKDKSDDGKALNYMRGFFNLLPRVE